MVNEKHVNENQARWYFGGIASTGSAFVTHPLDLLKVALQMQKYHLSVGQLVAKILREQGVLAFYNGLSATIMRQMSYSTTRYGVYEAGKNYVNTDTLSGKIGLASLSGLLGGIIPIDMINVRMQSDVRLPAKKRRNYKHVIDGIIKVYRHEGFLKFFASAVPASARVVAVTVGQMAFYDEIKEYLLASPHFDDDMLTHFSASLVAGAIATTLSQPMDVLKTRQMHASPEKYKGLLDVIRKTAKEGPLVFYKGYSLAFLRIVPHTMLTRILLEQLRIRFGYRNNNKSNIKF